MFRNLDEVVADIDLLRLKGYDQAGSWNLTQASGHLANWLSYPIDGYPKPGCLMGLMMWMLRNTAGNSWYHKIVTTGKMPAGKPTLKSSIPASDADETAAVNRLKDVAIRLKNYKGEVHPSPVFGKRTVEDVIKLQLIHCAHHLSFLIPKAN